MSLWLCLRFHQLPLHCLNRSDDIPVVVLARQRVLRANDCATALGIREGMGTATVRALAGDEPVQLLERDCDSEQRCLHQLCCWAYTITPTLHTWREDCLQLEIGGCLKLSGGLSPLLMEVTAGLAGRGHRAQYALAPTPRAAWLLSFAEGNAPTALGQPLQERLAPLPLTLLDEFPGAVDSLRRAGLHTLGDILTLPSSALGRRCGREFVTTLQQILGQRADLQEDFHPPSRFSDEYWFGYEVKNNEELQPAIQWLLQSLCRFLRNTQLQTAEICWQLIGIDHKLQKIHVRSTTAHSNWRDWHQLTNIRFEQLQLTGGVEGLALHCPQLHPGELESIDLFTPQDRREPLAALLDRLRNRLGLQAVEKIACRDEHLPEFALHVSPEVATGNNISARDHCAQRPFWLLPGPQLLRQRGKDLFWHSSLELIYGPERIEDNWWRQAVSRDYYIAGDSSGHYYWIFRDRLAGRWYVHGIFP